MRVTYSKIGRVLGVLSLFPSLVFWLQYYSEYDIYPYGAAGAMYSLLIAIGAATLAFILSKQALWLLAVIPAVITFIFVASLLH